MNTFFVLDVLSWRGHPVSDSEAEFRFFWLTQKLAEQPTDIITPSNPYRFLSAPRVPCTPANVIQAITTPPVPLDGLLFYHNEACYTPGPSPLVLWLKPEMVPASLGLPIPVPSVPVPAPVPDVVPASAPVLDPLSVPTAPASGPELQVSSQDLHLLANQNHMME
eukprot:m.16878 g.16878  ORF g.16878 m.16878 type:complete len:165 (-) comp6995_c0_seq2:758-1252(-)